MTSSRIHGFLSPNDVRELENMDLIPDELGGNRYLCNGNMIDIGSAGKTQDDTEQTQKTKDDDKEDDDEENEG